MAEGIAQGIFERGDGLRVEAGERTGFFDDCGANAFGDRGAREYMVDLKTHTMSRDTRRTLLAPRAPRAVDEGASASTRRHVDGGYRAMSAPLRGADDLGERAIPPDQPGS